MNSYRSLSSLLLSAGLVFLLLLTGCSHSGSSGGGSSAEPFKIGIIPYENPSELQELYQPFANYLGKQLNKPAQVFVAQDYVGIVQALKADQIDAAYLNPLSYVLFEDEMKASPQHLVPIAMPYVHGSLYYYGVIFTTTTSGINTIADLKGKKMAFSDPTSTSGYLYPSQYLLQHGIDPAKDFPQKYFAGADNVVPSVLNGTADAGAVFEEGLALATKGNPKNFARLKVLARVGPIANGMLVVRGDLDPSEIAKIKTAMQTVNTDPDGQAALKQLQVAKWVPADDTVFNPVREAASVLGLKIADLKPAKK